MAIDKTISARAPTVEDALEDLINKEGREFGSQVPDHHPTLFTVDVKFEGRMRRVRGVGNAYETAVAAALARGKRTLDAIESSQVSVSRTYQLPEPVRQPAAARSRPPSAGPVPYYDPGDDGRRIL